MLMSRLSDLYNAVNTFRKEGIPVDRKLEQQTVEQEEKIIKEEVLPLLIDSIESTMKPIQSKYALYVDYTPGQPLSVNLVRKNDAENSDVPKVKLDPEVEHARHDKHDSKITRSPSSDFSVTFPDGTKIAEHKAADSLELVVRRIGVAAVRQVVEAQELVFCKVPVISNRHDKKYGKSQRDLGNGWLLMTHCCNRSKKKFLDAVSDALNLGLKVEIKK